MKKQSTIPYFLILSLFIAFLAYPLINIFFLSLELEKGVSLNNFSNVLKDDLIVQSIFNSFSIASSVALTATIIGLIVSYTRNFIPLPSWYKSFLEIFSNLPMFLPTIVYGFAIIYIFGRQGILTQMMHGKTLITVFGPQGVFIGLLIYTIPVSFMIINNSMKYLDPKLFIVSRLMGDNGFHQFITCIFRPLLGTLLLSFIQTFFLSFTDFGLPIALAGNYPLLSTSLYTKILGALPDFSQGSVVAILMLLPTIFTTSLMVYIQKYNVEHRNEASVVLTFHKTTKIIFTILSTIVVVGIMLIFIPIFIVPFVKVYPYNMNITFEHFKEVFSDFTVIESIKTSLILSILTVTFGTTLVIASAYLSTRSPIAKKTSKIFNFISNVTNAVPGMVLGVSMMICFSGTNLQNSFIILVIANCIHFFATPYAMANSALLKLSPNLEKVSILMGDSFLKTIFHIILPNIRTTIFAIMNYLFVNSMVTISALIFLVGITTPTVTTKMKELQNFNRYDKVFVLALLLFIINLMMKYVFYKIGNSKNKIQKKGI